MERSVFMDGFGTPEFIYMHASFHIEASRGTTQSLKERWIADELLHWPNGQAFCCKSRPIRVTFHDHRVDLARSV
jgi:hypothetical protein